MGMVVPKLMTIENNKIGEKSRTHRTLLRRIYVKFVDMQKDLGSKQLLPDCIDWPVFFNFLQNGDIIDMTYNAKRAEKAFNGKYIVKDHKIHII